MLHKSTSMIQEKERDLVGDRSVLILGSSHRWWILPLTGEEEDDGCGGVALGASLYVALLSVQSSSGTVRTQMICVELSSPS
jgi:hypothetical protein